MRLYLCTVLSQILLFQNCQSRSRPGCGYKNTHQETGGFASEFTINGQNCRLSAVPQRLHRKGSELDAWTVIQSGCLAFVHATYFWTVFVSPGYLSLLSPRLWAGVSFFYSSLPRGLSSLRPLLRGSLLYVPSFPNKFNTSWRGQARRTTGITGRGSPAPYPFCPRLILPTSTSGSESVRCAAQEPTIYKRVY